MGEKKLNEYQQLFSRENVGPLKLLVLVWMWKLQSKTSVSLMVYDSKLTNPLLPGVGKRLTATERSCSKAWTVEKFATIPCCAVTRTRSGALSTRWKPPPSALARHFAKPSAWMSVRTALRRLGVLSR
jgi:hypothetical protein